MPKVDIREIILSGTIAGAAGGLAEVAWIAVYAATTGGDAATIAKGVTTAAGASALLPAVPVQMGVAIHMGLSLALGIGLAFAWHLLTRRSGTAGRYGFCLAALLGVWFVNFFIVLPLVSPGFIQLVSYPVSLTSKLLFGLAAAHALQLSTEKRQVAAARLQVCPQRAASSSSQTSLDKDSRHA